MSLHSDSYGSRLDSRGGGVQDPDAWIGAFGAKRAALHKTGRN